MGFFLLVKINLGLQCIRDDMKHVACAYLHVSCSCTQNGNDIKKIREMN